MIRIAIVEDDAQVREQLVDYVHRYERQFGRMFELTTFSDGDEIVSDYRPVYDIILLDVQMQRMDGMAAAEAIRQVDSDVILIFITNMAQFAIRGYAVDALDYVLKPVPYFAFTQQLQKAVNRLQKRQRTFLTVAVEGGLRRIAVRAYRCVPVFSGCGRTFVPARRCAHADGNDYDVGGRGVFCAFSCRGGMRGAGI